MNPGTCAPDIIRAALHQGIVIGCIGTLILLAVSVVLFVSARDAVDAWRSGRPE